ncbi:hypothetical protein G3I40_08975 [Streptomyces sp. SID14478]|uniref:hypothetical protein n=1 Tax=Streptomyces sp. SID14478 TaxID=2706073 RepID=UPI0013D98205|nr:hypothetical protein [Streptomyces sp. SID14478]NEB75359.1 hypothetical protein [Streptomyces sp. SID14478]
MGPHAAKRTHAAARRLADELEAGLSARIDLTTPEPHTVDLLVALHVLVEAGAEARRTAGTAKALAGRLEGTLAAAEPASGYRNMLRAGRPSRDKARSAVAELRTLMADAQQAGLPARFAQTSVDLLRAPDHRALTLSARADYERRTGQYYGLPGRVVNPRFRAQIPDLRPKKTL